MPRGNHRGRLWLPPGTQSVKANDLHEVMTVREWLEKPLTPATRGEVAAFGEALVTNQVADLLRRVMEGHVAMMTTRCRTMIAEALAAEREGRWYRRLWHWIATFGHRPVIVAAPAPPVPEPEATACADLDEIDQLVGEAEGKRAPEADE